MSHLVISAPASNEYAPYYGRYIGRVQKDDILSVLSAQLDPTLMYLRAIPESRGEYSYAPGKWTIKQVTGHIVDAERLFAYRALSFARADVAPLPGMEQEDWMKASSFNEASLRELTDEFEYVRRSTILFFRHLSQGAWMRSGIASENPFTVRAIAYIIAGHLEHHLDVLRTRYA